MALWPQGSAASLRCCPLVIGASGGLCARVAASWLALQRVRTAFFGSHLVRHSLASDSFRKSQDGSLGGAPPAEEGRRTSTAAGQSRRPRCRPRCKARRGRGARKRPRRSTPPRPGAPVGPASASVSVPRPSSSSGPARSLRPSRRRPVVPSEAVAVVDGRSNPGWRGREMAA